MENQQIPLIILLCNLSNGIFQLLLPFLSSDDLMTMEIVAKIFKKFIGEKNFWKIKYQIDFPEEVKADQVTKKFYLETKRKIYWQWILNKDAISINKNKKLIRIGKKMKEITICKTTRPFDRINNTLEFKINGISDIFEIGYLCGSHDEYGFLTNFKKCGNSSVFIVSENYSEIEIKKIHAQTGDIFTIQFDPAICDFTILLHDTLVHKYQIDKSLKNSIVPAIKCKFNSLEIVN